jgi:hypothetical protein
MEAGEVQVMGTLMGAGDAAPARTNWASKANGGAITKFTSQYDDSTWAAANLILSLPQPVRVSYLKVVFLKNGGGSYMEAGEVRAYGR